MLTPLIPTTATPLRPTAAAPFRWGEVSKQLTANATGFVMRTNSPHDYAGAIGAAGVRGGTAEWRVRVDLGPSGSHFVSIGVARAGVALHKTCRTGDGERFGTDSCRHYSAYRCDGYVFNALDSPTKRYKQYASSDGVPACKSGDVVAVRLDAAKGTLAYSHNGKLFKTLTVGVKANLPLALVASTDYNGASVNVVGYKRAP